MSPLDLGPELDIILGWDWLSSHDFRFLYPQGCMVGGGAQGSLSAPYAPLLLHPPRPRCSSAMANFGACSDAWYQPASCHPTRPLRELQASTHSRRAATEACRSLWTCWARRSSSRLIVSASCAGPGAGPAWHPLPGFHGLSTAQNYLTMARCFT